MHLLYIVDTNLVVNKVLYYASSSDKNGPGFLTQSKPTTISGVGRLDTYLYVYSNFNENIINNLKQKLDKLIKTTNDIHPYLTKVINELDKLENLSTILDCAYCSTKNVMTFIPDQYEKIQFKCSGCNNNNSVVIQFMVARTTEPLEIKPLTQIN